MITSKHASVVGLFGLLALAATQGCGSDSDSTTGFTAGSSGAPTTGAAGSGVSGSGVAGSPSAGAPSAGAPGAGAPAGGAGAGTGGDSAGTGGSSAGTGGSSAGTGGGGTTAGTGGGSTAGAGGGGSTVTFAQIKSLFATSCGVGQCHTKASGNLDYQATTDLHGLLTSPIPQGIAHCVGSTPVKAGDANSWLLSVVKMGTACPVGGGNIGRMPDSCKTTGGGTQCLTTAQIKLISDWIAGGAPG
jgi:hypothetical protein